MRKASICLGANSALTGAGRELLTLLRKPEVYEFQRISEALKDALSVLYITSAVDELTEVFIDDDAEVSPKIVHITSCRLADENEIHFDVSGVFEIRVTDPKRWSRKFEPVVKVDRMTRETIRNGKEKDAYA